MFGHHRRQEAQPPAFVSPGSVTGCGHHRYVGTCPSCQRAKAAALQVHINVSSRIAEENRRRAV